MKRAWIIGNGPSLKPEQLDLLKDEVCFASNRIHLIYDKTTWRPKYYLRSEDPVGHDADVDADDIAKHFVLGIETWMPTHYRDGIVANMKAKDENGNLKMLRSFQKPTSVEEYFPSCGHETVSCDNPDAPTEWHLPRLCLFGTVTSLAIQIAVKKGYGPIYLVGVDGVYTDAEHNHFDDRYEAHPFRWPAAVSEGSNRMALETANRCSPVPIYDCTVGGKLNVFPRMTIEEVLSGERLQPGQGETPGPQVGGSERNQEQEQGSPDSQGEPEVRKERSVQRKRSGAGK